MTPQTDVWLASVIGRVNASAPMVVTFRVLAPWEDSAETVATDVANAWSDDESFVKLMSDDYTVESYIVGRVQEEFLGLPFSGTIGPNSGGLVEQAIMAPQAALIVTKRSNIGGHKGRGRMYIPALTPLSANADRTAWSSSEFTNIDTCVQTFFSLLQGGESTQGMSLPNGTSSDPITVTSLAHRSYFGTQRRRATTVF